MTRIEDEVYNLDPYLVLDIDNKANDREIKKAYHKKCLLYHPDKNPGYRDDFDKISFSYMVLSDPYRRKKYDEIGVLNEYYDDDKSFDWAKYFRSEFTKISKDMIDEDKLKYQGSKDEKEDIIIEFNENDGNIEKLFQTIPHLEYSDKEEKRVFKICQVLIKNGKLKKLEGWKVYAKERDTRKAKLQKKRNKEIKEASKYESVLDGRDVNDLADLKSIISGRATQRKKNFNSMLDRIEDKYVEDRAEVDDFHEDEEKSKDLEEEVEEEEESDYSEAEEDNDDEAEDLKGQKDDKEEDEREEEPAKKKRKV